MNDQTTTTTTTTVERPILHLSANDQNDKKKNKKPRVRWQDGTVDNENMNKKKSKICCIFHPQKDFDELVKEDECSCESESESESDSDSDSDDEELKKTYKKDTLPGPNSYEIQPKYGNNKPT